MSGQYDFLIDSVVAGVLASMACGLGALPLAFPRLHIQQRMGLGYGFAGGLMIAASMYHLILPSLTMGDGAGSVQQVLLMILGILLGAGFLSIMDRWLTEDRIDTATLRRIGGRREILIFLAMALHSLPEGIAVGVGFASSQHVTNVEHLGTYIALAIAIHNIPEGLAVSIPMRAKGASITKCFVAAFATSLPQPIAALPAALLVWLFEPLMVPFLGFAAGAMIFLVLMELIPEALADRHRAEVAWAFMLGFCLMVLIQVVL